MKTLALTLCTLFMLANTTHAEEWAGIKMLVEQRAQVISACEQGILNKGYAYVKVKKFCTCMVDHMTHIATTHRTKERLLQEEKLRGKNFIRTESQNKCRHFLE